VPCKHVFLGHNNKLAMEEKKLCPMHDFVEIDASWIHENIHDLELRKTQTL